MKLNDDIVVTLADCLSERNLGLKIINEHICTFPTTFKGPVSTHDNRVLNRLTRSAALRFAPLASLTHSVHGLAHSLRSLPRGTAEIHEYVFTL